MYQLARVRRNRTGTNEVKRKGRIGSQDILQFAISDEVVRQTVTVLQTQLGVDVRFTKVDIHQQHFLSGHGVEGCQVS